MERGIGLIVIGTLFQEELLHLGRRDITVVDLQLAVRLLIEDMIVVEHGLHLYL